MSLCCGPAFFGNGPSPFFNAVTADNPAHWWRLGDSGTVAVDRAGGVNGVFVSVTTGQPGLIRADPTTSTLISGDNLHYISLPNFTFVSSASPFMVGCWFKKIAGVGPTDYLGVMQLQGAGDPFRIILTGDPTYFPISFGFNGGPKGGVNFPFDLNKHQLMIGYNWSGTSTGFVAYIDGLPVTVNNITGPFSSDTLNYLGKYGGGNGSINANTQEIIVFNSILSAARVAAQWAAGN